MARSSSYNYDPQKGTWTKNYVDSGEPIDGPVVDNSGSDNLTSSNPDEESSAGSVEKEYNTIEINTLTGELNFIVTKETIKLKAGNTVRLLGLGKHLSGYYYVKEVVRQIGSDGYSHSATLIKTDFGSSLKVHTTSTGNNTTAKEQKKVQSPTTSDSTTRTYTVKKGDVLWKIAKDFYGDGKLYTKIYDANSHQIANPDISYIGQVLVIP